MSEEEEKAIKYFEFLSNEKCECEACQRAKKEYKTILNLIENQQKEIEELIKMNTPMSWEMKDKDGNVVVSLKKPDNYISKDKIREIIKKYQEKAEDVKQKYKGVYAYKDDYLEALAKIEGYQELLEENDE